MRVLYLYAEVMGYTMATLRALVDRGAEVHVVHWDHKKLTPYRHPVCPGIRMYSRSDLDRAAMLRLVDQLQPDITVISGWMDKGYVEVAKEMRSRNRVVVTGLDSQWLGTWRQWGMTLLAGMGYFKKLFSHAWVCGPYQYEYARRIGFKREEIIFDLYSADLDLFGAAYRDGEQRKRQGYPHRFLFVGRFESVKGLDILITAWSSLGDARGNWELHLVGNGSLKPKLISAHGVVVKDFMQPEELMREVVDAGCFILPSRSEPWGVVIHEFAAAGLPLIVSDAVGAASVFLIPGKNGYSFKTNASEDLAKQMRLIIQRGDADLCAMSIEGHALENRITPFTSADNLLSLAV